MSIYQFFNGLLELPLYVPLIAFMIVLVIISISRRLVRETMTDERSRRIEEKATDVSYRIYAVTAAVFSLTVLSLKNSLPPWMSIVGETLAYSLCVLMLIHLAMINYFQRKL
jgi:uncharacterized membrane protein